MKLPNVPRRAAFVALKILTGVIFVTHGAARLYYGTVPGFGEFLNAQGLMLGLAIAWFITVGEIVSGSCLALGVLVRYCALFHLSVIVAGIFMVHIRQGWFTIGQSAGGVEYSLLLAAVLVLLYSHAPDHRSRA